MKIQVIEVKNPRAFDMNEMRSLLREGFAEQPLSNAAEVEKYLRDSIGTPSLGFLVARDETGEFVGFSILDASTWALGPMPMWLYLYAPKRKAVKQALIERSKLWYDDRGIHKVWALNGTGKPEEEYAELFSDQVANRTLFAVHEFSWDAEETQ